MKKSESSHPVSGAEKEEDEPPESTEADPAPMIADKTVLDPNNHPDLLRSLDVPTETPSDAVLPKELEIKPSQAGNIGIWSKVDLIPGIKFGPFPAKFRKEPSTSGLSRKVIDATGTISAWLDFADSLPSFWVSCLRCADDQTHHNSALLFTRGQLFLEITRPVDSGKELLLFSADVLFVPEPPSPSRTASSHLSDGSHLYFDSADSLSPFREASNAVANQEGSQRSQGAASNLQPTSLNPVLSPGPANCPLCDLSFSDTLRLNEHLLSVHYTEDSGSGEREYKCAQCPKVFNWKSNLIRHQVAHDLSRRYICESCKKVFTDPSNLQRHIRSQHIGARSHACPECGKTFATSSGLKQHTHIHSSIKPFRCEVCFKAYTQFSNLCRHKRMHATCRMQIKCHRCGQAFSTVTSLSKHKRFCEGTSTSTSSTSATNAVTFPLSPTIPTQSIVDLRKTVPMSVTPPTNPLVFYPRTTFPFYPAAAATFFGYPTLFPGGALPAPSPLVTDSLLSSSSNGVSKSQFQEADSAVEESRDKKASAEPSSNDREESSPVKKEKNQSEASESELSDEVTSETIEEDLCSGSDSESEAETGKKEESSTAATSSKSSPGMLANHRESSPKQGAVCPEPASITPNGYLHRLTQQMDMDMPFDLSRNKNRVPAEESPEYQSRSRDHAGQKDDQPLDLRVSHKKAVVSVHVDESVKAKSHTFGSETRENPSPVVNHKTHELQRPPTPSKFQMAYPRPIHPMLLESMYRIQQDKPAFPMFGDHQRLIPPFPPRYPLISPLLTGTSSTFDFMRAHVDKVTKPVHEILNPHLNKSKERYSCKFCGKIFPRSANLTRHLRTHTGEQPYKCKYCERSFSISSNLQRHVRNIHNKEKPFKCPLCDRCFGQQTNLDRHLKKHESDGPTILDDSPRATDLEEKDETYFDEIRNFIGKVTECHPKDITPSEALPSAPGDLLPRTVAPLDLKANGQSSPRNGVDEGQADVSDEEPRSKKSRLEYDSCNGEDTHSSPAEYSDTGSDNETRSSPHSANGTKSLSPPRNIKDLVRSLGSKSGDMANGLDESDGRRTDLCQPDNMAVSVK